VYKSLPWKGTSLKISNNKENQKLIKNFKKEGINLREDEENFILENQFNYFIFEDEFIAQSKNLSTMIDKYLQKEYNANAKIYLLEDERFGRIQTDESDKIKYRKILENNILDGDKRELDLSINVLNEVLSNNNSSKVFLDILILFLVATKSSYDAETLNAEFRIEDNSYEIEMNITDPKPIYLYPIYNWIVNDEEYEESYNVKLHIVRQVIVNKKNIIDVEGILKDSKLAYKRIISKKTNEYFEQLNQMKNDFLVLSNNEKNALRTLNVTFFAWIGYLGIELFNIITKYDGNDILHYLLFSKGDKKGLVVLMFIIALIFIFVAYVLEIDALKKTYEVIKKIYKDKILFEGESSDENKFGDTIKKPEVGKPQRLLFTTIIIILVARFFATFPW